MGDILESFIQTGVIRVVDLLEEIRNTERYGHYGNFEALKEIFRRAPINIMFEFGGRPNQAIREILENHGRDVWIFRGGIFDDIIKGTVHNNLTLRLIKDNKVVTLEFSDNYACILVRDIDDVRYETLEYALFRSAAVIYSFMIEQEEISQSRMSAFGNPFDMDAGRGRRSRRGGRRGGRRGRGRRRRSTRR